MTPWDHNGFPMKQIEFSEEMLGNPDLIAAVMFSDPEDPRSSAYRRKLERPKIPWLRMILSWLGLAAGLTGLGFTLSVLKLPAAAVWGICMGSFLILMILHLKKILIRLVQIYQRLAPASLRNKCRFEPSCSQYMLLSLQKYGVIKGLKKGIGRLKRCNIDGGGFDDP